MKNKEISTQFYPGSVSMSSTKQLTKSEANLHEIQQNTSRSPSTGLQDIGYHHYPSTVHKKSWQKIHYWMKVFMCLCNTQGNYLKWSLRLSGVLTLKRGRGVGLDEEITETQTWSNFDGGYIAFQSCPPSLWPLLRQIYGSCSLWLALENSCLPFDNNSSVNLCPGDWLNGLSTDFFYALEVFACWRQIAVSFSHTYRVRSTLSKGVWWVPASACFPEDPKVVVHEKISSSLLTWAMAVSFL